MRYPPSTRICIVGAGAAGLSAAEALKDLGYRQIVLLEQAQVAGGKCRTMACDGRAFELGAGIVAANDHVVQRLAARAGVALKAVDFGNGESNLYDPQTGGHCPDVLSAADAPAFLWQLLLRYRRLCRQYASIAEPGLVNLHPDLCEPFVEFAAKHGIELVARNFERFFTGFGYGYWDEIPAAYVLKYYSLETLKSYLRHGIYSFPDGIQRLWKKLAANHDVRYGTRIQSLTRGTEVSVDLGDEQLQFDVVLLSCPLDEALTFLDASPEERALFAQIRHVDYRTFACRVDGFVGQTGFIPDHFQPAKKGHPLFWYRRYSDSDVYMFYVIADAGLSDAQVLANIKASVSALGGSVRELLTAVSWKYFPHVSPQAMRDGYFDRLGALQGSRNSYYIGELLNFSTVGLSAQYADHLVSERF